MYIKPQRLKEILANKPKNLSDQDVIDALERKGFTFEQKTPGIVKVANAIGEFTGISGVAKSVGGATSVGLQNTIQNKVTKSSNNAGEAINEAKKYPVGSPERKRLLELARSISNKGQKLATSNLEGINKSPTALQSAGSTAKVALNAANFSGGLTSKVPGLVKAGGTLKGFGGTLLHGGEGAAQAGAFQVAQNFESGQKSNQGLPFSIGLGFVIPVASEAAIATFNKLVSGLPQKLINSDIKPGLKQIKYGQNPGRGVVTEKITANNVEELANQIDDRLKVRGEEIGNLYRQYSDKIDDYADAIKPLDDAIKKAQESPRTNAALIKRLENAKEDLLKFKELPVIGGKPGELSSQQTRVLSGLTPEEGFKLKEDVSSLTQFNGTPSDDSAYNNALHKVYWLIKSKLNNLVPGLEQANEHFADLKSAYLAAKHTADVQVRQNMISLVTKLGGIGAIGYGAVTGDVKGASIAFALDLAAAAFGSTAAKTRIASFLASLPVTEREKLLNQLIRGGINFGIGNQSNPTQTTQPIQ